jgi:hypothetical protein
MKVLRLGLVAAGATLLAAGCSQGKVGPYADTGGAGGEAAGDFSGWSLPGGGGTGAAGGHGFGGAGGGSDTSSSSSSSTSTSGTGGATPLTTCHYSSPRQVKLTVPRPRALGAAPLARAAIGAGSLPDTTGMHASQFLNYYPVTYPPSTVGPTSLAVSAGMAPGLRADELVLQVAVAAPQDFKRPPVALVVVVDTSLSLGGLPGAESSFDRARFAALALAEGLRSGDAFTVITSHGEATPTPIFVNGNADLSQAQEMAKGVMLLGGEDMGAAIHGAYEAVTAMRGKLGAGALARVAVITDGGLDATSVGLAEIAKANAQEGIRLMGVGVGEPAAYQPDFVDILSWNGGGAMLYVDSEAEAEATLHHRFDELVAAVATGVTVTVNLPDVLQLVDQPDPSQGGGDSTVTGAPDTELGPGHTLIFRRTLQTCVPNPATDLTGFSLDLSLASAEDPAGTGSTTLSLDQLRKSDQEQMAVAEIILTYGEAVSNVRLSLFDRTLSLIDTASTSLNTDLTKDPAVSEIQKLAQAARDLPATSGK